MTERNFDTPLDALAWCQEMHEYEYDAPPNRFMEDAIQKRWKELDQVRRDLVETHEEIYAKQDEESNENFNGAPPTALVELNREYALARGQERYWSARRMLIASMGGHA